MTNPLVYVIPVLLSAVIALFGWIMLELISIRGEVIETRATHAQIALKASQYDARISDLEKSNHYWEGAIKEYQLRLTNLERWIAPKHRPNAVTAPGALKGLTELVD